MLDFEQSMFLIIPNINKDASEEDDSFFYKVGLTVVEALSDYDCEFDVLNQVRQMSSITLCFLHIKLYLILTLLSKFINRQLGTARFWVVAKNLSFLYQDFQDNLINVSEKIGEQLDDEFQPSTDFQTQFEKFSKALRMVSWPWV